VGGQDESPKSLEVGGGWRPARAIRWTSTHVMVGWVEESGDRRDERWEWLRAQDVMRSVRWLVRPARA